MAVRRVDVYKSYLNEIGITPRLTDILGQLCDEKPLPEDPLDYILRQLGCPLIPVEQINALEEKVNTAYDELRFLRNILCDLGYEHECRPIADSDAEHDQDEIAMPLMSNTEVLATDDEQPCCSQTALD